MAQRLNSHHLLTYLDPLRRWAQRCGVRAGGDIKIGVAVSGGPDSMALAYLLKNMDPKLLGYNLRPTAFIVDHAARLDSEKEAEKVASWCQQLGIPALTRRISWKPGQHPLHQTNFETLAREYRYDLLCEMARKSSLLHIFLGHHQDDELEFLLIRLSQQQNVNFSSLLGMRDKSPLPPLRHLKYPRGAMEREPPVSFEEILGLQPPSDFHEQATQGEDPLAFAETDLSFTDLSNKAGLLSNTRQQHRQPAVHTLRGSIQAFRHGGIGLYRPLLSFSKADLVKTCQMNNIQYVHDRTNDDPTFTIRNAVRLLRQKHQLPRALQTSSLLQTLSHARHIRTMQRFRVSNFLRYVSLLQFDLRSGVATVEIPVIFADLLEIDRVTAAFVAFQLSELVSSHGGKTPSNWQKAAYWAGVLCQKIDNTEAKIPHSFTWRSVQFDLVSRNESRGSLPPSWSWRLSRMRSYPSNKMDSQFQVKPSTGNTYLTFSHFWDSRYWVELSSNNEQLLRAVQIRRFTLDDSAKVRSEMTKAELTYFDNQARHCAPGDIRYTLPVLATGDQIITFPTLSTKLLPWSSFQEARARFGYGEAWLKWSVVYRVIDVDLPLREWGCRIPPPRKDFSAVWRRLFPSYVAELPSLPNLQKTRSYDPEATPPVRYLAGQERWLEPDSRDTTSHTQARDNS